MLKTYDLKSVQDFANSLDKKRTACNDEGVYCSDLDEAIRCQYDIAVQLNHAINIWVREVLAGNIEYEPAVESILVNEIKLVLDGADPLLEEGRDMETECYSLAHLTALQQLSKRLAYLNTNWISPRKSVSPALRVKLDPKTRQEINDKAAAMSLKPKLIKRAR